MNRLKKYKEVKEKDENSLRKVIFELMSKNPDLQWSIFNSKNKKGWVELWIKEEEK